MNTKLKHTLLLTLLALTTFLFACTTTSAAEEETGFDIGDVRIVVQMVTTSEFGITWNRVPDTATYYIYVDGVNVATREDNLLFHEGLEPNTTYEVRIRTVNEEGERSNLSEPAFVTTVASDTAPMAPFNLHSMGETDHSIDLMWGVGHQSEEILYFEIWRDGEPVQTTTETRIIHDGLEPDTEYRFTVRALSVAGEYSLHSNEMIISTMRPGEIGHGNGGHGGHHHHDGEHDHGHDHEEEETHTGHGHNH